MDQAFQGGAYRSTLSSGTINDGAYHWKVSTSLPEGNDYSVRVNWLSNTSVYDTTTPEFSIVQVASPPAPTPTPFPGPQQFSLFNAVGRGWSSYE